MKEYKTEAALLRQTGGGVQDNSEDRGQGDDSVRMRFYVPGDGPQEDTPEEAVNLWCGFFHCDRPNF
jgi:hypothetical protein